MLNKTEQEILFKILSQPTAPFRENFVRDAILEIFDDNRVAYCLDSIGNIIVGAKSLRAYKHLIKRPSEHPPRLFIAHMDHPGFHGVRWLGAQRLAIKWHGGSPKKHLVGAKMWLADSAGERGVGLLRRPQLDKNRTALASAELHLQFTFNQKRPLAKQLFGGFTFRRPYWLAGARVYTRVADDLVGVFAIVAIALRLARKRASKTWPFIGLLTRAEEVGFIGAIGHIENHLPSQLRHAVVAVSLEASRTLPGARVGAGPVVRLGDRRTVFDQNALQVLTGLAQKSLPGQYQRRIMDGGACEGCVATAYGIPVMALSVPLGNYHNQGFEGGQDCPRRNGPAPEFVHLDDIERLLTLCEKLVTSKISWSDPWMQTRQQLQKLYKSYQGLL